MINRNFMLIVAVLVVGSGCGAADATDMGVAQEGALLRCGSTLIHDPDGSSFERPILYSRYEMDDEIARKKLIDVLGFHKIDTCEQAALAAEALNADGNFEPGSGAEAADLEEKLYREAGLGNVPGTLEVVVDSAYCTGTLLNAGTAITAAHCVYHVPGLEPSNPNDARAAIVWTRLNLWRPQTGLWHCLTGGPTSANGKCIQNGLATIWQFGPYWGAGNHDSTIALITVTDGNPSAPNPSWPGLTNADFMRVYTGSFNNFSSYSTHGAGIGNPDGSGRGIMRYSGFGNDGFGDYAYYSETRTPRICGGDAGAPSTIMNRDIATNITYANAIGHISGITGSGAPLGTCAGEDHRQYGTRLHTGTPGGSKIDWVQSKMWLERRENCFTYLGSVGNFRQCF